MDVSIDEIEILDDAVGAIRRNPDFYAGPAPRGPRLASGIMKDLIDYGDLPATMEHVDGWWLAACETDWLARPTFDGRDHWEHIVPTPEVGVNGMRCEVLLRALCAGLVTATAEKVEVLVDEVPVPCTVDARIKAMLRERRFGRVVAFCSD